MSKSNNSNWVNIKISDYVDIVRGYAFKTSDYESKGHPIVRVTNISSLSQLNLTENMVYLSTEREDEFNSILLRDDDFLMVMVGATIGKYAKVITKGQKLFLNQNMWCLRVKKPEYNSQKFVFYALQKVIDIFLRTMQGSARNFFTQREFEKATIELPPLPEQKKIADILTNIDREILLIKDQKEKYNQLLNATINAIFQKLKQSFPTQKLLDACSLITKGATPTTYGYSLSNKRFAGSITFLGGGSTSKSGGFDLTPARYCTDKAVSVLKRSQLSKGDTLVTIVGASIGNTCQMPSYVLPANINQNVALVRADQSLLSRNFANLFLRTLGRQALIDIATTQAQPSVSLKQVGELQIPIPDIEHQLKINQAVKSINIFIDNLEKKIKKKELLKKAISCDLLSGHKRVNV